MSNNKLQDHYRIVGSMMIPVDLVNYIYILKKNFKIAMNYPPKLRMSYIGMIDIVLG